MGFSAKRAQAVRAQQDSQPAHEQTRARRDVDKRPRPPLHKPAILCQKPSLAVWRDNMRRVVQRGVLSGVLAAGMAMTAAAEPPATMSPLPPKLYATSQSQLFASQSFKGDVRVPAKALAAATGLKKGDRLSEARLLAARQAIAELYGKQPPGKEIHVRPDFLQTPDGIAITWIIGEAPVRHLVSLKFVGNSRISSSALTAATGLKIGDPIPREKVFAARQAIMDLYAKSMPGRVSIRKETQIGPDGSMALSWVITEPK